MKVEQKKSINVFRQEKYLVLFPVPKTMTELREFLEEI